MIQLSPQTEPASSIGTQPDIRKAQESEEEFSEKSKPRKNQLGVFSKILAGLTNKGQPKTVTAGTENKAQEIAQNPENNDVKLVSKNKEKNGKIELENTVYLGEGVPLGENVLSEDSISLEDDPHLGHHQIELSEIGITEQEIILSQVNRLATQGELASAEEKTEVNFDEFAANLTENDEKNVEGEALTRHFPETKTDSNTVSASKAAANAAPEKLTSDDTFQRTGEKIALENEKNVNRPEDLKNRDRRRNVKIDVKDFRSAENQMEGIQKSNGMQIRTGVENRIEGSTKEITLELRLPNQGQQSHAATTTWEVKSGQHFSDLLARELHQNFNNDIVRHASVALRDGNNGFAKGTIRLVLKPESLGNVKIHLELAENKITGQIVVESKEALRAFEKEILSLEKAFQEQGFDGANLEMSLAADSGGAEQWQETEASRALPGHFAASRYDAAVENIEIPTVLDFRGLGTLAVNVLA